LILGDRPQFMRLMATFYVYNVPYSGDSNIAPYSEDHKLQFVSSIDQLCHSRSIYSACTLTIATYALE
jgi:hypothetical protein